MSLYRNILTQALKTALQSKYLWFFGLFAALIGSGGFEIIGQSFTSSSDSFLGVAELIRSGQLGSGFFTNLSEIASSQPKNLVIMVFVYLIILSVALFITWLSTVSQIAIVKGSAMSISGGKHDFSSGMNDGTAKFWPVLALNILIKLLIVFVLFLVNLPLLFGGFSGGLAWLYFMAYIVAVPMLILASFVIKYVIAYVVLKNDSLNLAVTRGFRLFKKNWIISIEMSLLQFLISFLVTVLALLVLSVLYVPLAFLAAIMLKAFGIFAGLAVFIVGLALAILLLVFIGSFDAVFQIAAWTGLFIELTGRGGESKIERVLSK
jgi:hypothetical protein